MNPHNRKLIPGGSAGGSAVAVALYATAVDIGDSGRSVRIPVAFSGAYDLRPTIKRLTILNSLSGGAGQEIILTQVPINNSLNDVEYYIKMCNKVEKLWLYDPSIIASS